jgi:hypothetical protein
MKSVARRESMQKLEPAILARSLVWKTETPFSSQFKAAGIIA